MAGPGTWRERAASLVLAALLIAGCAAPPGRGPPAPDATVMALLEQGTAAHERQDYATAIASFRDALEQLDRCSDPSLEADIQFRMGRVLWDQQAYRPALSAFERALALARQRGARADQALLHNSIGTTLQALGDIDAARQAFTAALCIRRQLGDPIGAVRSLLNLASTELSQGRYQAALAHYAEARAQALAIEPPPLRELSILYTHMGSAYAELGQYEPALEFQRQALDGYRQLGDQAGIAACWHNIGLVHGERRQHASAIAALNTALAIRKALGDKFGEAKTLNNLGMELSATGQTEAAETVLLEALQVLETLETRPQLAATLDSMGNLYLDAGRPANSLPYLYRALALWRETDQRDGERITLGNIGHALQLTGQKEAAVVFYKLSVNVTQAIRGELSTLSRSARGAYVDRIDRYYRQLADLLIDLGRLAEAEQVLAMLKEEEYFEFLRGAPAAGSRLMATASFSVAERPWAERYDAISSELVRVGRDYADLKSRPQQTLDDLDRERLTQLEADMRIARRAFRACLRELEAAFVAQSPQRAKEFGAKELQSLRQLQTTLRQLGRGTVLIHTLLTDERLRLLLTTAEQQLHRDSPVTASELNRRIVAFRDALQTPGSALSAQARNLYQTLLGPLAEDLRQAQAETLLLSLDDTLRYLPFAALHDGRAYLVERYRLVVYTAAARAHLTTTPRAAWRVAGLGVSKAAGDGFPALPEVRRELDTVVLETNHADRNGVLPGVIALDEDFTSDRFTAELRAGFPVVHIASHFQFLPGTEDDSFLLLGDGRKLTLADLQDGDFPLDAVDLLTLSACETAYGGRDARGREIEGFAVLAQQLGAKAVVATLWPVADASTATFMAAFYRNHETGITKAEALRRTQIEFASGNIQQSAAMPLPAGRGVVAVPGATGTPADATPGTRYSHPYYWAPFVLIGNSL